MKSMLALNKWSILARISKGGGGLIRGKVDLKPKVSFGKLYGAFGPRGEGVFGPPPPPTPPATGLGYILVGAYNNCYVHQVVSQYASHLCQLLDLLMIITQLGFPDRVLYRPLHTVMITRLWLVGKIRSCDSACPWTPSLSRTLPWPLPF